MYRKYLSELLGYFLLHKKEVREDTLLNTECTYNQLIEIEEVEFSDKTKDKLKELRESFSNEYTENNGIVENYYVMATRYLLNRHNPDLVIPISKHTHNNEYLTLINYFVNK